MTDDLYWIVIRECIHIPTSLSVIYCIKSLDDLIDWHCVWTVVLIGWEWKNLFVLVIHDSSSYRNQWHMTVTGLPVHTAVCKKVCISDYSTHVCLYLIVLYISGPRPTKTYGTTIRRRHLWVNPYRNQRFAFPLGVGYVSGSWNI